MKALSLKSDHVDTNMNVGHMYRIQERWDEAKERYETVLRRRPGFFKIQHHLGFVNEQLKQYKVSNLLKIGQLLLFHIRQQKLDTKRHWNCMLGMWSHILLWLDCSLQQMAMERKSPCQ